MKIGSLFAAVAGALGLAAAVAYAPAASADRVGFSVSVGGPGYGVTVGNVGVGYYGGSYAPAPVVVPAPVYVAPPVVPAYRPYRPYYAPVVVAPRVVVARPFPVYRPYAARPHPAPYYGYGGYYGGRY